MNVFIILSILIIVIGVLLIVATPSVLFKFNWNEKTGLEKILVILFYCILLYIINIIYWFINWMWRKKKEHRIFDRIILAVFLLVAFVYTVKFLMGFFNNLEWKKKIKRLSSTRRFGRSTKKKKLKI